jgi:Tol biopolymer transport system component
MAVVVGCVGLLYVALGVSSEAMAGGRTERVNVSSTGAQANDFSPVGATVSADGRFVAFTSDATNLVADSSNGHTQVFVRDRLLGTTSLVSVSSGGALANQDSYEPAISADGRFVAFSSYATNLVPGATTYARDMFVRDMVAGTTELVSVSSSGAEAMCSPSVICNQQPAISADGRFVAFTSCASNLVPGDTNDRCDVFVRDRVNGSTGRVSVPNGAVGQAGQGNGSSYAPSISADGRFVAFTSCASNLVPGDTNGRCDEFVRDRSKARTGRVSISTRGAQGNRSSRYPSISADGRFVAFTSNASNLVAGDTNHTWDVFLRDRGRGTTSRNSVSSTGAQANNSSALVSVSVSADGRYVAFPSLASNLVPHDTNGSYDVFVRDRATHTTGLVSASSTGVEGDGGGHIGSTGPALAANGGFVVFESDATNLVPNDTNGATDVFIHRPLP